VRSLPAGLRARRVGFRSGTDAELTALHTVESEVEAERRPDRVPQPLDSYMAFARSLPAQFHDHTWVVDAADGTPVATAACWSNDAGDARVMECDLVVRRPHRRRGIGSHLLALVGDVTKAEGRSTLTWSTFDAVPAGDAFSQHVGGRAGRVNRTSELRMADIDWSMVDRWMREGPARAPGYRLEMADGALPAALHADAATFHHIMQTMPRDDLDTGDVMLRVEDVAELDRARMEAGRDRWTVFVRDPSGACVGGTEVDFEPWEPSTVLQQNTGIDPAHRGLGLAKWAKAMIVQRLRDERPHVERVRTGNAFSNAPMLAINDALGFRVISSSTDWQAGIDELQLSR
jgi:GNAT superfamily N-acetyltransferase